MSDKINNSELDYSDNLPSEQVTSVELTSHDEPIIINDVESTESTEHVTIIEEESSEPIKQTIEEDVSESTEHVKIIDVVLNEPKHEPIKIIIEEKVPESTEPIKIIIIEEELIEPIKQIIEEKLHETTEPIKITIDLEPIESTLIPNNIEPNNLSIISGSDDVIKATSITLEQESKQETLVSSIELEEVNNNKTHCCFFFQYPKWRK